MRFHTRATRRRGFEMRASSYQPKGQVSIFVVLAMALFLLGFVGFAVDMTNLWFHRQMAQGAADAACQAGIMDVFVMAQGANPPSPGFIPGVAFDCTTSPNAVPCRYADLNGYNGLGLIADTPSNQVAVSFPRTVPGTNPPPPALAPIPYLRVDVVERVGLTFASLILGRPTGDVRAFAECAVLQANTPIPIIVLNPVCSEPFSVTGSAKVTIIGGPEKSVQVNSDNACAASTSSSGCLLGPPGNCPAPSNAAVDLCQGGPSFSGSEFGVLGGPTTPGPNNFYSAENKWTSPAMPIQDPYKLLPEPGKAGGPPKPGLAGTGLAGSANPKIPDGPPTWTCPPGPTCDVPHLANGCPDPAGCLEFAPGWYTQPIIVPSGRTAIFDPGLYYIEPTSYPGASSGGGLCGKAGCTDAGPIGGQCRADFVTLSQSLVRPSTAPGDPSYGGGTVFYMTSAVGGGRYGSAFFGSNTGARIIDPLPSTRVTCTGGPTNPPLPANLQGNILLGPCSGPYAEYSTDPNTGVVTPVRGILFFQDRANKDPMGQATFQGNGTLVLAGTLYFHNCPNSTTGPCAPYNTDWNAFVQFQGTPGSLTRVVGNVVVDQFVLAGNASVNMILDPNRLVNTLKASLVR